MVQVVLKGQTQLTKEDAAQKAQVHFCLLAVDLKLLCLPGLTFCLVCVFVSSLMAVMGPFTLRSYTLSNASENLA